MKTQTLTLSFEIPAGMTIHPETLGAFRTVLLELVEAETDDAGGFYAGSLRELMEAVRDCNYKGG